MNNYHPRITDLFNLNSNAFPDFATNTISSILNDLYYYNLQSSVGSEGGGQFYSFTLITNKGLSCDIFGLEGFEFGIIGPAVFPVELFYELPIKKYFRSFILWLVFRHQPAKMFN